jgi:hypothetical protein
MARRLGSVFYRGMIGKTIENCTEANASGQAHEEKTEYQHCQNSTIQRLLSVALGDANGCEDPVKDSVEARVGVEQDEALHRLL